VGQGQAHSDPPNESAAMTEDHRLPIAVLLARLRREARLSQAELAERVNEISGASITRWDISCYERGVRIPTVHLPALAVALGVEPDILEQAASITQALRRGEVPALQGDVIGRQRTVDDEARLIAAARNPSRIDSAVVTDLSSMLAGQRRIEDIVGAGSVIEPATGQLKLAVRLLRDARGPLADDLAAVGSEASQFAGWLHTATGRHDAASDLYDQALRLGLQAGDEELAATALSMRGHLSWVTGDTGSMAALSEAAQDMARATGTRTVAIQQRGRALAILGDRQGTLRAIREAEEELAGGDTSGDPDSLYFYGPEILMMQRGLILAYLADTPADYTGAANMISTAVEALPPSVRDSEWVAWYRVRAAAALANAGEAEGAVDGLRQAHAIVSTTGGSKTLTDIAKVQARMVDPWPTHPAVTQLGAHITKP
jgi:tetratricopeptide (TPR) repeat protein